MLGLLVFVCAIVAIACCVWAAMWAWAAGLDVRLTIAVLMPPMLLIMVPALGAATAAGMLEGDAPRACRVAWAVALALCAFALAWPALHIYAGWSLIR